MKSKNLPLTDIVQITKVVKIEIDEDEESLDGTLEAGTYALDSQGKVWRLEATLSEIFQAFDAGALKAPDDQRRKR